MTPATTTGAARCRHPRYRSTRRGRRPYALTLVVTGTLLTAGVACSGPPPVSQTKPFPQVQARYDRAVAKALDEIPDSRLLSVTLTDTSAPEPVWRTRVSSKDGTVHMVRVDAVRGTVLATGVPSGQTPTRKAHNTTLTASAKLLPQEAVDTVRQPEYGTVTDVRLATGRQRKTVWSVTITSNPRAQRHVYQVDAVTAGVVDSHTSRPQPSAASPST